MNYDPLKLLRESAEFWIQNGDAKQKTREFISGQLVQMTKDAKLVDKVLDEFFPVSKTNGHSTEQDLRTVAEVERVDREATADEVADAVIQDTKPSFADPLPRVPQTMKHLRQWIRWKLEPGQDGKPTKIPYQVSGAKASSTDPSTWTDYRSAVTGAKIDASGGVGFVVAGEIVGFDLDGCYDALTDTIAPWAKRIIDALDSYTEITPSETGLRVWVRGVLPGKDKVFKLNPAIGYGTKVQVEVFTEKKYFTVTGWTLGEPTDVQERDLNAVYQMLHEIRAANPAPVNQKAAAADAGESTPITYEPGTTFKTDKYTIFKHGHIVEGVPNFQITDGVGKLTYPSHSEADLGFATVLAIRHDCDEKKMEDDFRDSPMWREKWERTKQYDFKKALETTSKIKASKPNELTAVETKVRETPVVPIAAQAKANVAVQASQGANGAFPFENTVTSTDDIPAFDESVITGIYKQIVDLVTDGTTIPKQFAFLAAKVFIGARLAGKVTFENMDADSSYYGVVIAETGTGKGLAWRRTVENCLMIGESLKASVKIIQSADSGAGLKDAFFEDNLEPLAKPLICYVDEATSLGHKAGEKKNPEIVDTIIELADGHRISRVLTKNGKKRSCTNDNARLSLYMCGQNGEVFMQAFAGRTKLGLYDRFYPEYSPEVEAGDLPDIDLGKAARVWTAINDLLLKASGQMKMADGVKPLVEEFWKSQPKEHRSRVRWKKHLMLDMYMAALGRGSMMAEEQDWESAKKIYLRQVAIREKHFTIEVPDKIGVYNSRLRVIVERMRARLNAGESVQQVALSQRDFMTATNAYRDNDIHTFNMAWRNWESTLLAYVTVKGKNGQDYRKYVPMPNEDETWAA